MPSTRAAILAIALAAARLSASAPLDTRVPDNGLLPEDHPPCTTDKDCKSFQECRFGAAPEGEMTVAVKTCLEKPNVNVRAEEGKVGSVCSDNDECDGGLECRADPDANGRPEIEPNKCRPIITALAVNTRDLLEEGKSCGKDSECKGDLKCLPDATAQGEFTTEVLKCQGEAHILPIDNTKRDLFAEGHSCSKDSECLDNLKCLPDAATAGEFTTQVLKCQGEAHILPVADDTKRDLVAEGESCSKNSECEGDLKCLPDTPAQGEFTTEVLKCQKKVETVSTVPVGKRQIQPEAGSPCTGTDDEGSCPGHQICLPFEKTKMYKCQDKPEGYCEDNDDCEGNDKCLKLLIFPEPKSGTCA